MKKIPRYKLILSEDSNNSEGVSLVSFVQDPAIQQNFVYFGKDEKPKKIIFSINEDRKIVTGPVLIPDMEIFRNVPVDHYVSIDKGEIEKTVKKFFKTNRIGNVNAEHSTLLLAGIYPFESFVSDASRGILAPVQFNDLPDGTWFMSYNLEDSPEMWSQVKEGTFKGFSIEGLFQQIEIKMSSTIQDDINFLNLLKTL